MSEQTKAGSASNPKKKRKLSRPWIYEQLADIHLRGLADIFEAIKVGPMALKKLTDGEQVDWTERLITVEAVQTADVVRAVEWRLDNLRYIVGTAADSATPARTRPLRIPAERVRPLLDAAERKHRGSIKLNRLIADQSGIPPYTIRRIRSGERKWLTPEETERLLFAAGLEDAWRQEVEPLEEEHAETEATLESKRVVLAEELAEELRPILRILTAESVRRQGDYSDDERRALADWSWMHEGDWCENVVPLFTPPNKRNAILMDLFRSEFDREPEPLPEHIRQRAIDILRNRQEYERARLTRAEKAISDFPLNTARIYEATRGARRAGYLPAQSKPHGYPPVSEDPFLPRGAGGTASFVGTTDEGDDRAFASHRATEKHSRAAGAQPRDLAPTSPRGKTADLAPTSPHTEPLNHAA